MRSKGAGVVGKKAVRFLGQSMKFCWNNPRRTFGWTIFAVAFFGVSVNALFLQSADHPAPFLAKKVDTNALNVSQNKWDRGQILEKISFAKEATSHSAKPLKVTRLHKSQSNNDTGVKKHTDVQYPLPSMQAPRQLLPKVTSVSTTKKSQTARRDLIGSLIGADRDQMQDVPRPPGLVPNLPSRSDPRIAAAQKALVRLGHQLTVDGLSGPATRRAIEKFQRANNLPITGKLAAKTARILSAKAQIKIPR